MSWTLTYDAPSDSWYIPEIEATIPALDIDTGEEIEGREAEARRAAAADDLYDACNKIVNALFAANIVPQHWKQFREAMESLASALAKANGQPTDEPDTRYDTARAKLLALCDLSSVKEVWSGETFVGLEGYSVKNNAVLCVAADQDRLEGVRVGTLTPNTDETFTFKQHVPTEVVS